MAHTTHCNTHVHIWKRHRTHTHTCAHRPEVEVNLFSAFFQSWNVLPPGPPRSRSQKPLAMCVDIKGYGLHKLNANAYICFQVSKY